MTREEIERLLDGIGAGAPKERFDEETGGMVLTAEGMDMICSRMDLYRAAPDIARTALALYQQLAEAEALARRFEQIADEIDTQVQVTRAYATESGMDHNQRELMEICTSHFLDKARTIRAEAAALRKGETK